MAEIYLLCLNKNNMIHIEQDQSVPENENLRVLSVSGDYDDNDLIECYHIDNPGFALSAFSSTFVKYGGFVYQFSDPVLLGKALLEIDPGCTHNAATLFKEEDARRIKREDGDFTPENPVPVDESISLVAQEEAMAEQVLVEPVEQVIDNTLDEKTSTSSDSSTNNIQIDTSSSSPVVNEIIQVVPTAEPLSENVASSSLEAINKNVDEIIDVANKSQEIINALTDAPIN